MSLIIIGGATASGKSALAVELALELGAEIVSADSMQLYKGMDIGTAKITMEERKGVPHHMLDMVSVREDVTASWYQGKAREIIDTRISEGKHVVVVGGTGLYIKAIVDDLNFPDTDPDVRNALEARALAEGGAALHAELARVDPAAALAIPAENIRRVIRALEVFEITGQPFTAHLPREGSTRYPDALHFALETDRPHLDERINARVDLMWERGLVAEVRDLINEGLLEGKTAKRAIGYAQVLAMAAGEIDEKTAIEATKIATRQYVRRQDTWFNRDERISWLPVGQVSTHIEAIKASIIKA